MQKKEPFVMKDKFIEVLLPLPLDQTYTYKISDTSIISRGQFVRVSFRGRSMVGVVWGVSEKTSVKTLKEIEETLSVLPFSEKLCEFLEWVSRYTLSPKGSVLKLALGESSLFKKSRAVSKKEDTLKSFVSLRKKVLFTEAQEKVVKDLLYKIDQACFSVSLLDGVTGSGKTEVYFEAIEKVNAKGGQALVLLPEISLSAQWIDRFKHRFGFEPFVWHSDLKAKTRKFCWESVAQERAPVVVGARSALFLPFSNLQFIVVDEEHEMSFKQDEGVLYHGRDMAIVRAKLENIPILLASATPSLESLWNAQSGRFTYLLLKDRAPSAQLPYIEAIDMRLYAKELKGFSQKEGRTAFLSPPLRRALLETFEKREQSLLFLNRRGYAPLTLCRECGYRFSCPDCSAWLVFHQKKEKLQCHHCGYEIKRPKTCPNCEKEETLAVCGPGVERIFEEVSYLLPEARIDILSSDTLTHPKKVEEMIDRILKKEVDILIGTQVVAKGHHFPDLTLVGVVDADLGLTGGDLRASEKTYQVLHQVSGRSGRARKKGHVFLQTFCPEHGVMEALLSGDRDRFLEEEMESRKITQMPPFGKLAALIITSHKAEEAESVARALGRKAPLREDITILGPTPAPLFQLGRRFRWRFLIKATKKAPLHGTIEAWLKSLKIPPMTKVHVDIDPYRFL